MKGTLHIILSHVSSCQEPGSLEEVPLTFIDSLEQLEELQRKLMTVSGFAVDLEVGKQFGGRERRAGGRGGMYGEGVREEGREGGREGGKQESPVWR